MSEKQELTAVAEAICHRIKVEYEDLWRNLGLTYFALNVLRQLDDPVDKLPSYLSVRYLRDIDDLKNTVKALMPAQCGSNNETLAELTDLVWKLSPKFREKIDHFTEAEKAFAISTVKKQLPEDWARLVHAYSELGTQLDHDNLGMTHHRISDVLKQLQLNWFPGSFDESGPRFQQLCILGSYVRDAAGEEALQKPNTRDQA